MATLYPNNGDTNAPCHGVPSHELSHSLCLGCGDQFDSDILPGDEGPAYCPACDRRRQFNINKRIDHTRDFEFNAVRPDYDIDAAGGQ